MNDILRASILARRFEDPDYSKIMRLVSCACAVAEEQEKLQELEELHRRRADVEADDLLRFVGEQAHGFLFQAAYPPLDAVT